MSNHITLLSENTNNAQTFDELQTFMNNLKQDVCTLNRELNDIKQVVEFLSHDQKKQIELFQQDYMGIRGTVTFHVFPLPEHLQAVMDHEAL